MQRVKLPPTEEVEAIDTKADRVKNPDPTEEAVYTKPDYMLHNDAPALTERDIKRAKSGNIDYNAYYPQLEASVAEYNNLRPNDPHGSPINKDPFNPLVREQQDRVDIALIDGFERLTPEEQDEIIQTTINEVHLIAKRICPRAGSCLLVNIIIPKESNYQIVTINLGDGTAHLVTIPKDWPEKNIMVIEPESSSASVSEDNNDDDDEKMAELLTCLKNAEEKIASPPPEIIITPPEEDDIQVKMLNNRHNPWEPAEAARLANTPQAYVENNRIGSILAISRSVGDSYLSKFGVSKNAEITRTDVPASDGKHRVLLTACDGLTESNLFTDRIIGLIVEDTLANFRGLANRLAVNGIQMGSGDNTSVIAIRLSDRQTPITTPVAISVYDGHGSALVAALLCKKFLPWLSAHTEARLTARANPTFPDENNDYMFRSIKHVRAALESESQFDFYKHLKSAQILHVNYGDKSVTQWNPSFSRSEDSVAEPDEELEMQIQFNALMSRIGWADLSFTDDPFTLTFQKNEISRFGKKFEEAHADYLSRRQCSTVTNKT